MDDDQQPKPRQPPSLLALFLVGTAGALTAAGILAAVRAAAQRERERVATAAGYMLPPGWDGWE